MKANRMFMALAILVLIHSCASHEIGHSKDVNQDEINQGFFISYNQRDDLTEITAFFRFAGPDGTTLILDSPSQVDLNGEPMKLKQSESTGAYYYRSIRGILPEVEYRFVFTDLLGKTYTNALLWKNMEVESLPDSFSHKDGLVINFTDDPEGRRDEITVEVSDSANTVTETVSHVRREKIRIDGSKLQALHGPVQIRISRNGSYALKSHAHAGGYLYTQWEMKPFFSVITD